MERNLITLGMVGRVSYLGRVNQGNYHTHVLHTIPNPNYTLPKPYTFIITYPIHHPTLGTQTGRVLPFASINTTVPWIPTYPYPSIVIPYRSTYIHKYILHVSSIKLRYKLYFSFSIPTPGFLHFYYMLGANLGLLLYGEVSVMHSVFVEGTGMN